MSADLQEDLLGLATHRGGWTAAGTPARWSRRRPGLKPEMTSPVRSQESQDPNLTVKCEKVRLGPGASLARLAARRAEPSQSQARLAPSQNLPARRLVQINIYEHTVNIILLIVFFLCLFIHCMSYFFKFRSFFKDEVHY